VRAPTEPCRICGYEFLERGQHGHGVDGSETECPVCLAQYALDDDGSIEFMYDLPNVPLTEQCWPERWAAATGKPLPAAWGWVDVGY
jgi:hypothetical protein